MSAISIFNFSEKLQSIFEIGLKNYRVFVQKSSHGKHISKEKLRRHTFVVYVLIYLLSKFGGNRRNSLWVLAFTVFASNQTGNFYFRPKLKTAISLPTFNCYQWFLFYIRDFTWSLLSSKNRNLKNADRKVHALTLTGVKVSIFIVEIDFVVFFRNEMFGLKRCQKFIDDQSNIPSPNHKTTISSLVIGFKMSYFPLIHLPSCYRTVCHWIVCYWTVCYRTV